MTPDEKTRAELIAEAMERAENDLGYVNAQPRWNRESENSKYIAEGAALLARLADALETAWQRSQPVEVTEAMVGAVIAALGAHRWKTMGVGTVECECGEVMSGPGVLEGNFPADEAFRDHLARAALRAALGGEKE